MDPGDRATNTLSRMSEIVLPYARKAYRYLNGELSQDKTFFDPGEGEKVVGPAEDRGGYWAGAPSAVHEDGKIYLYYRLRKPRERGHRAVIAESSDGENFSQLASLEASDIDAISLEGAELARSGNGYRLYLSYQSSGTGRWNIDLIEADHPSGFRAEDSEAISFLRSRQRYHYKDPVVSGGEMFAHTMSQAYLKSQTIQLMSSGKYSYRVDGEIRIGPQNFPGARITGVLPLEDSFLVFYDWRRSILFTWEEKAGVAVTRDFENFESLIEEDAIKTTEGTGSLRYIEPVKVGEEVWFYYEVSTENKGHELRVNKVSIKKLKQIVKEKV